MSRRDPVIELYFGDLPYVEEHPWKPAADILKTREEWIVKLDLAGVSPDDLSVTLRGRMLHVSGVRRDLHAAESVHHYRMEIAYSAFERSLEIPCNLENCAITTLYQDGILLVVLRRKS